MKNESTRKIINVDKCNYSPIWTYKQEDDGVLKLALFKGSTVLDITGQTIKLGAKRPDNSIIELTNGFKINKNELDIILKNNILAIPGIVECDLEITDAGGKMTTASFYLTINKKITGKDNLDASNDISAINKIVAEVLAIGKELDGNIKVVVEEANKKITAIDTALNKKLNEMQEDYDSLQKIIIDENQAANLQAQINKSNEQLDNKANETDLIVERNRIDTIVRTPGGSDTEGNAELMDLRNGADGKTYEIAGEAIRSQFRSVDKTTSKLIEVTSKVSVNKFNKNDITRGYMLNTTVGTSTSTSKYEVEDGFYSNTKIKVNRGDIIRSNYTWITFLMYDKNYILRETKSDDVKEFTIGEDVVYMLITYPKYSTGIVDKLMITVNNPMPATYVGFGVAFGEKIEDIKKRIDNLSNNISNQMNDMSNNVNKQIGDIDKQIDNLATIIINDYKFGGYGLYTENGITNESKSYWYSKPIECTVGDVIKINKRVAWASSWFGVLNKSGVLIPLPDGALSAWVSKGDGHDVITISEYNYNGVILNSDNIGYIIFSFSAYDSITDKEKNIIVKNAEYPTSSTGITLNDSIKLTTAQKAQVAEICAKSNSLIKKPFVVLNFDAFNFSDKRFEILQEYGFKATVTLGTAVNPIYDEEKANKYKRILNSGWDIGIYSATKWPKDKYGNEAFVSSNPDVVNTWEEYVKIALKDAELNGVYYPQTWFCRQNAYCDELGNALKKHGFKMCRGEDFTDYKKTPTYFSNIYSFVTRTKGLYPSTVNACLWEIDQCVNDTKGVSIFTHGIYASDKEAESNFGCTEANLRKVLDRIKKYVDEDKLEVLTYSELYNKYNLEDSVELKYNRVLKMLTNL